MGDPVAEGAKDSGARPFGSRLLGPAGQSGHALRVRVQVLLSVLLITTNLVGAVLVVVISRYVVPSEAPRHALGVALAIAVPLYVVLAILVGAIVGTQIALRQLRWATEDRDPTAADRDRALRVPLLLTAMQAALWLGAVVLFTLLAVGLQASQALSTGLTVAIAGVVVTAIAYLLSQFTLRPIAAKALASQPISERPRGAGVGDRMIIFWALGTGVPTLGIAVSAILELAGASGTSGRRLGAVALVISGVVLVFGAFVTVLNARSVVAPVLSLRDALLDVERGDLDREVVVYDGTELGLLQSGFNQMVAGLREREHLRDLFGRHVGQDVARKAVAGDVELGGETRVVSVLFVDLVGSTAYATRHTPSEVVAVLNRFFGVVVDEVAAHSGLVNKFIGDAVLAVFGAPVELDDHATAALAAARRIAERLAAEVPEIGAGVGVATGEAVAGNVGHHSRFEYTVIGDAVNSASRLTDLAKDVDGHVLVARASVEAAEPGEAARWRDHDEVTLRGRTEATPTAVPR